MTHTDRGAQRRHTVRRLAAVTASVFAALGVGPVQAMQGAATGPLAGAHHPHYLAVRAVPGAVGVPAAVGIPGPVESLIRGCLLPLQSLVPETCGVGTPLAYGGGAIQAAPAVYIVFWGWNGSDPAGQAAYQTAFFNAVGGSSWNASQTQYCEGASSITLITGQSIAPVPLPQTVRVSTCPGTATFVGNPSGLLQGTWSDAVNPVPASIGAGDIQAEAVRAAAFFGNTTPASNAGAQYIIDTPHGSNTPGFGTQWCAWHNGAATAYGNLFYTDFPYISDAGAVCYENAVNAGAAGVDDGVSIAGGHEFAESETDPFPGWGWTDTYTYETGDKCVGMTRNVSFGSSTFAVQSLWSNNDRGGAGGCVFFYNSPSDQG